MKSSDIHLRASWQEIPQPSITEIICKIKYLEFYSNFSGANGLISSNLGLILLMLCYLHTPFHEAICIEHYGVVLPKWNTPFNTTDCEKLASSLFELPKETITVALKLLFTQFMPGSAYMSLPVGSSWFYAMLVDSLAPRRYLNYLSYWPSAPSRQASVDFEREC